MKKIDLHMHSIPTISDSHFKFSLEKLKEYVSSAELDAIAITNHDMFDLDQFNEIVDALDCVVFPGIEINLESGHVLVISENENLDDFQLKANAVSQKIIAVGDSISVDELVQIFGDLNNYLVIPHYEKRPCLHAETIRKLRDFISAGEVDSPKKFVRMAKDDAELTPVIFSDVRISEGMNKFPTRQTYIDCGDLSIKSLKFSLRDKTKVTLSKSDGNSLFQVFDDGQKLSTGLNIVLGARSSGKTVTLTQINSDCENVKYIPQFSLVQRDDANYEKEFNADVARKKSAFADKHLAPFKAVLDDVLSIDLEINQRKVTDYLETLLKSAEEVEKYDSFSRVNLFNETLFEVGEDLVLSDLINSVRQLIENIEYRGIIDKHVDINDLKALACELIVFLWSKAYERKKKCLVNDIIRDVKSKLQLRTSATQVKDVDLYKIMLERKKVSKFNEITKLLQKERVIFEESFQGFKVVCKQRAFEGAGEIKNVSGQRVAFSDAYKDYSQPHKYLSALKTNEVLTPSELYKYFACIEYEILNKDGFKVSGGERSEFRLLQEIKDAQNFDYLLIDEPESSFDNLFLRSEVNQMLKEISRNMPVVIVTHNSVVGASIKPDYIIYTAKEIEGECIVYRRYSGHPSDRELNSTDGKKINNFQITIDSLEAGEAAYLERKAGYENIKN
ncbi:phosphotransferase [Pseudomonas aeruginosa]|uniref:phosphotransferase n=1 Tax=Pseudomonas aeruginosa TaxID=287 RepID=UPI001CD47241|nr:phosphotransferase [Pseudomonas aeruginosa]